MSSFIKYNLAEIQSYLSELVASNLQVNENELDIEQPLFELGADSIVMATTLTAIKEKYGISIKMLQLFEDVPDIKSIAEYINKNLNGQL